MNIADFQQQLAELTGSRHLELSAVISADDPAPVNRALVELTLSVARVALDIDLKDLSQRLPKPPLYPDIWPGEHYKLLAALVKLLSPKLVIEIGTATGLSALALKKFLSPGGQVVTFDIVPWQKYPDCVLREDDFHDGRLKQVVADLTNLQVAQSWASLLKSADFIFIDAAKDGSMEAMFVNNFVQIGLREGTLLMFDDIRLVTMIPLWKHFPFSKLDITSFGHWSGTGLMLWAK